MIFIKWDIIKMVIYYFMKNREQKISQISKKLFFGQIITMCTGGFIPMSIAAYLGYLRPCYTNYGEHISNYFTYLVLFLVFVFYPLAMIANICVSQNTLSNESYKQKWGPLYAPNKIENRWQRVFRLQFIIRRFLVLAISFSMNE